jgi:nitrous oxidase accessory protein NosD
MVSNNSMDGIDLDAHSDDGTALFNVCSGNQRQGIFIEEAIRHHIAFGNQLAGNRQSGIHIWNEEVEGNTGSNVVAANECFDNFRGISLGARAADRTAHGNLLFNNICRQNREIGLRTGNTHARENYISQTVVWGNQAEDLQNPGSARAYLFDAASPHGEDR